MEKPKAIIEVINIKKSFGELRTLEDVSLSLEKN
ncbi:MAG: polar amino acid ABC transporter ATP-binding protein, partial [Actinobacteria bacterium]|nr:polar amino acid ABC transporter ATP-binding protein [Actinomycetota bacterium]